MRTMHMKAGANKNGPRNSKGAAPENGGAWLEVVTTRDGDEEKGKRKKEQI